MKQLADFDLSIIIPIYCHLDEVNALSPSMVKYYERNGIEVVIVVDKSANRTDILNYIRAYPFISWKVIVSNEGHMWKNLGKVLNIGIRQATKQYILIMNLEQEFYTDVIYELREKLEHYPEYYAISHVFSLENQQEINEETLENHCCKLTPYGSIMAKKEYFERIGGYSECQLEWNIRHENLCIRFDLAGIRRLHFPDAVSISQNGFLLRIKNHSEQLLQTSQNILSEKLLPTVINENGTKWGYDFNTVVYDWKTNPFAKQQCCNYLATLKQFDILSDEIFDKTFPLIALIPTYNESERIAECLRSAEKYCDGIILLDDDSKDDTYQLAQSKKLLVKAKKCRTEFNDKENRNILLDIASFFKAEWFFFLDADERFDDRFVNIREVMKKPDTDVVGVWIANLWNDEQMYRTDMNDTNPYSCNGLWFRWRMFRNKGKMQINSPVNLHFSTVPYMNRNYISKTLLLHLGYLNMNKRMKKYLFYQQEDRTKILNYENILCKECKLSGISNITSIVFEKLELLNIKGLKK